MKFQQVLMAVLGLASANTIFAAPLADIDDQTSQVLHEVENRGWTVGQVKEPGRFARDVENEPRGWTVGQVKEPGRFARDVENEPRGWTVGQVKEPGRFARETGE